MTQLAELVLADPAAIVELPITELAARAGTSAATVTRFCRLVGFGGYVQFRVGLAADLGRDHATESWRSDIGTEFDPEDSPSDLLRTLVAAQTRALEATAALVKLDEVAHIAKAIWVSPHLDIYGIGGSAEMASELKNRLYRIGVNAHAWPEVHQGLASAAILTPDSVGIAISNSGRTTETIEMLELASSSGALTVAITSDAHSPLAKIADLCVVNATPKRHLQPDDMAAKHAQLLVLDLLYLLIAQQDPASSAARLAASRLAVLQHRRPLSDSPTPRSRRSTRAT
jgi:DNA-binding MurR/RpiR family transcriptional regulator